MQPLENSGHDIYKSGYSIRLGLALAWDSGLNVSLDQCEHEAARYAVAAIVELSRDLLEPLEFGIRQCAMIQTDGVWLPAKPDVTNGHWYVKPAWVPPNPTYEGAVVIDTDVDESSMLAAVDTLFATTCDLAAGQWLSWDEIYVDNTLARVPESLVPTLGDRLVVDDMDNRQRDAPMPLTRRSGTTWVGRDGLGRWSPISLRIYRDFGYSDVNGHETTIGLEISVHWSVWWGEGSPGRTMLNQAVGRLQRQGWCPPSA